MGIWARKSLGVGESERGIRGGVVNVIDTKESRTLLGELGMLITRSLSPWFSREKRGYLMKFELFRKEKERNVIHEKGEFSALCDNFFLKKEKSHTSKSHPRMGFIPSGCSAGFFYLLILQNQSGDLEALQTSI